MKWIDKLERKFGKFGIPNLTLYIIVCYVVGYALYMFAPNTLGYLSLNVNRILHGEIWRLFTWIISPPSTGNVLLFVISIAFFYYPLGTALERSWGSFKYTLYILSGLLFTILGAFFLHFVYGGMLDVYSTIMYNTYYISLSIFLAFATMYPDMQILLWFVIPIRMKWMAYVYAGILVWNILSYVRAGAWFMAVPIVASLLNFVVFFLGTRDLRRVDTREIRRKQEFRKAMQPQSRAAGRTGMGSTNHAVTKHKCAICGRTELDGDNLEFRFCSKCNGNYEYCQDHLFTHQHIQ